MKKAITISLLLFFAIAGNAQKSSKYKAQFDALYEAVKAKADAPLLPHLASGYKIESTPEGFEDQILPQLLEAFPAVTGYEITGETKEGADTKVSAKFFPGINLSMTINKNGKITRLNFSDSNVRPGVLIIGSCVESEKE